MIKEPKVREGYENFVAEVEACCISMLSHNQLENHPMETYDY